MAEDQNNNKADIREVYDLVDKLRSENNAQFGEIKKMFDDFHREEFEPVRNTVEKAKVFGSIVIFSASFLGSFIYEWVKNNFKI